MKRTLVVVAAIVAITASAVWIWRTERKASAPNQPLNETVGRVMAEQTVRVVGPTGKVAIVTISPGRFPEIAFQMDSYQKSLKQLGAVTIKDKIVLDAGDNPKYGPGSGLSAKHFLKIVRKNSDVDAIVSFVGAPQLSEADLAQLKTAPKMVAETHSPDRLSVLFEHKILMAAVVPRFDFPAPGPKKPQTGQQWFDRYYQVVAPNSSLPKPDDNP